jgi:PAS domain S-box-containing protein
MKKTVKQHLGATLILSFLITIGIIGGVILYDGLRQNLRKIELQGNALTTALSTVSFRQLTSEASDKHYLQQLDLFLSSTELAYIIITDKEGNTVKKIKEINEAIPAVSINNVSTEITTHEFKLNEIVNITEFQAPVFEHNNHVGYIRSGYYQPLLKEQYKQSLLLPQVLIPLLLLSIYFLSLFLRQRKVFKRINTIINKQIQENTTSDNTQHGLGKLNDFFNNINKYILISQKQEKELKAMRLEVQTSNNLLTYQKRRVESALQRLPDAVVIVDETGSATFANHKVESITGITIESIVGKLPQEWCDNIHVISLLSQYHGNITQLHRTESLKYSPEKHPERTVSVSVYPLYSLRDTSIVLGSLVIFRDITEQVLATQSRDEFLAHVSHELKSPLNVINLHAELLLETDTIGSDESIKSTNVIIDEVERLSLLINDLLNISKFESGITTLNRQRVKIHDFLKDTFTSATRSAAEKNITPHIEIARSISTMNIDKDLFRVALNNILSNSVKYGRNGGKVSLIAEDVDDTVQIEISDDGIGIYEEDKKHIFEKFYRSESEEVQEQPGHGLGLALTKEIILLHGGHLDVQSEKNKGTTFTIKIKKTSTVLKEAV